MPEDPMSVVWVALALFTAGVVTVATRIVKAWGDQIVDRLTNRLEDEGLTSRVKLAKEEIWSAVDMVSQTTVAALKRASEDGQLTPDEAKDAMGTAVEEAKRRFAPEFWTGLMQDLGLTAEAAEDWIRAQAEAHLFRTKQPPKGE